MSVDSFLCDVNKLGLQAKAPVHSLMVPICARPHMSRRQYSVLQIRVVSEQTRKMKRCKFRNSQPELEEVDSRSKLAGEKGHMPKE